jgi:ATP/ADP translocase
MKTKIKKTILIVLLIVLGLWIMEIIVIKSRLRKSTETELRQINDTKNQ